MAQTTPPTLALPRRKRLSRLRLIIGGVIVLLVVGGIVVWRTTTKKKSGSGTVKTAQLSRGEIVQKISSTGIVSAETGAQVKIGSQITGRIRRLYADVGSQVQANQVIAELDAPDLAANLESARRSLGQATSKYEQQVTGVPMTRTQVRSAFEQASAALEAARSRAQQARISLQSAQSGLQSALAGQQGAQANQRSAEARLRSAQAASAQQNTQGSSDIARAQAGLSTAQAAFVQTQKSADVSVANASAAVRQAQATASLAAVTLKRQEALLAKGFVSQSDVDAARTERETTAQMLEEAQNSLESARATATSQKQSASDAVDQAKASLAAAQASSYTSTMRTEDIRAAEASLESAKTSVTQAQASVETARSSVANARVQVTSADSDVRSARAAQRNALGNLTQDRLKQQDVTTAYEAMQQAKAQVAYQEAQYAKSYIRTPISGTVISLAQQEGETVAAGLSAPELIQVAALDRMEVLAYVDETDIGKVKLGQEAEITVDAYPKQKFKGTLYKISSAPTLQQNVVTYACSVRLENFDAGKLKPQMTADVQIFLERAEDLLLVPNEALKQQRNGNGGPGGGKGDSSKGGSRSGAGGEKGGAGSGGRPGAPAGGKGGPGDAAGGRGGGPVPSKVVVMVDGKAEQREITTGRTDGSFTEVLSGLKDGDTVVLAGFAQLGFPEFASAAGPPPWMQNRTPFGTASGSKGGGGPRGGGGR